MSKTQKTTSTITADRISALPSKNGKHAALDPIIFTDEDLQPIEVPITLGKDKYWLCEASEDSVVQFRNAQMRGTQFDMQDGKVKVTGMDGMADVEPLLVSLCLFEDDGSGPSSDKHSRPGEPVSEYTVRGFKPKIVSALFARAKAISGLDADESEESLLKQRDEIDKKLAALKASSPKKSPRAMTGTSD
jgi:hypothetical protein